MALASTPSLPVGLPRNRRLGLSGSPLNTPLSAAPGRLMKWRPPSYALPHRTPPTSRASRSSSMAATSSRKKRVPEPSFHRMALLQPSDPGDAAAFPGLSDAQLGSVAEDRLATAIQLSAPGTVAVALPLLDLGFDLYPRRIR